MSTRNVSMGAPFEWLLRGLDVGRRNAPALFGGFALLLAVGLVPSVLQIAGDAMLAGNPVAAVAVYLVSLAVSLVLMPPLFGAAFRLLDRCERGQPAGALAIFDGFRVPGFAARMIFVALLFVALYLAVIALLYVLLPGKEALKEIFMRALATPPGAQPDLTGLPPAPGGLIWWLLGAMFSFVLLGNAYMLAFAQAALGHRRVVDAVTDGFAAAFRNLLPFLGFTIVSIVVGVVVLLVVALVIGLIVGLLAAISPTLAIVVALPLYLLLMLGLYVVIFGFYYHAWRDIFGAPAAPATTDDGIIAA